MKGKRKKKPTKRINHNVIIVVGICLIGLLLFNLFNMLEKDEPPPMQVRDVNQLIALSKSPDKLIAQQAIVDLGRFGDERAIPILINAIKDEDPGIRVAAARAMGRLREWDALASLIVALDEDEDNLVKIASNNSITRIYGTDHRFLDYPLKERRKKIKWFKKNYHGQKGNYDKWKERKVKSKQHN